MRIQILVLAAMPLAGVMTSVKAAPLDTSFTYQGQLMSQGVPLTGTVDLEMSLFDVDSGGVALDLVALDNVIVTRGLFAVELDFGASVFNGDARWLEIAVRAPHDPGDTEAFTTLTPRQPLTATPSRRELTLSSPSTDGVRTQYVGHEPVDELFGHETISQF